jgi:hypothetical protein
MDKENIELAKQHIELAEQIINEEARKTDKKKEKEFVEAEFALEKAESEIKDLEEN